VLPIWCCRFQNPARKT